MKTILLASGTGLLASLALVPALAGSAPPPIIERVSVSYQDLDLATPAGAQSMLARIETAATEACGGPLRARPIMDGLEAAKRREHHRCRIAAIDAATLRLEAPLVRAAWSDREDSLLARRARQGSADLLRAAGLAVPPQLAAD